MFHPFLISGFKSAKESPSPRRKLFVFIFPWKYWSTKAAITFRYFIRLLISKSMVVFLISCRKSRNTFKISPHLVYCLLGTQDPRENCGHGKFFIDELLCHMETNITGIFRHCECLIITEDNHLSILLRVGDFKLLENEVQKNKNSWGFDIFQFQPMDYLKKCLKPFCHGIRTIIMLNTCFL